MANLQIHLLGDVKIVHSNNHCTEKVTKSVQNLLAYFLLRGRRVFQRAALAGLFWGNLSEEHARNCLNTAVWRLRRAIEPKGIRRGAYLQTFGSEEIGFNFNSDYWLDIEEFERSAKKILTKKTEHMNGHDERELRNAVSLYRGELLEGFYNDWVIFERRRLHEIFLNSLERLMNYCGIKNDYESACFFAQWILSEDPLREDVHRILIELYIKQGHRSKAIRQYQTCCALLKKELNIYPMDETVYLYTKLLKQFPNSSFNGDNFNVLQIKGMLEKFYDKIKDFEDTKTQFMQILRLFELAINNAPHVYVDKAKKREVKPVAPLPSRIMERHPIKGSE